MKALFGNYDALAACFVLGLYQHIQRRSRTIDQNAVPFHKGAETTVLNDGGNLFLNEKNQANCARYMAA